MTTAELTRAEASSAADEQLRVDLRHDRVDLTLSTLSRRTGMAVADLELARALTDALTASGFRVEPAGPSRPVQTLEIAIDALDAAALRLFWRAVLAYGDEPGGDGPTDAVVDPAGQGPTIWFQPMDEPRPQRNRIHFDIVVAHDEADARVAAALAAGGRLVSDAEARAFWILADAEGNEVCVCTWQDRDPS